MRAADTLNHFSGSLPSYTYEVVEVLKWWLPNLDVANQSV
jgi:hypothetical protein